MIEHDSIITPLVVYFKGDRVDISKREIVKHAEMVQREIKIGGFYGRLFEAEARIALSY